MSGQIGGGKEAEDAQLAAQGQTAKTIGDRKVYVIEGGASDDRALRVELADTLADVTRFVRRFVVLSPTQADTLALWVAHTHAIDAADATPYLAITSAEKRSGKTRALEVLELLVHAPLPTANISDAALFRAISGDDTPTILLDEVDAIFGAKARDREDLRGLLNAGYRRGAVVLRMGGPKMTTLEEFSVFAAKVFAGIGDCLPDTIIDRAISIRLQRRTRDEAVQRFRRREVSPEAAALRGHLAAAVKPRLDHLRHARPELPEELDDRAQDVWEPLLALADLAGGEWPSRARAAALELSTGEERDDDSLTSKLIIDIESVFSEAGQTRLRTSDLIEHLSMIEESPWGDWYGKPITPQTLSKLLKPYRIKTLPVWIEGEKARGYKIEQFADAFLRVQGGRGGRDGRSESSSQATPTTPTAPTALSASEVRRLLETHRPELVGRNDITTPTERMDIAAMLALGERAALLAEATA